MYLQILLNIRYYFKLKKQKSRHCAVSM